jgi:leucyl-tRNA synthetase
MDYKAIEKKWHKRWSEDKLYSFDQSAADKKYYVLEMFSYPSASNLHVGHWYNYAPSDTFARYKRMCGFNVFHPMGFDAFGLPAENFAIKTGVHPKDSTYGNIKKMEEQLRAIGGSYDWDSELVTCAPEYYRWNQWLFLELYKKGLAYRREAPVNWCDSCKTVLANEQVLDGGCERCGSPVTKKNLTQWFFKITDYAERLLEGLDGLDWPEKTKLMQKNWIGKSNGSEIEFSLSGGKGIKVFTTRADTLFGVSYVVLAPEHPLLDTLVTPENKATVLKYIEGVKKTNEIERLSAAREKSGVFTGSYCINPISGVKVPVWTADYVLYSYGTGAVMGVPAHDERDFAFASKYNLPITTVIKPFEKNGGAEVKGGDSDAGAILPQAEGAAAKAARITGATLSKAAVPPKATLPSALPVTQTPKFAYTDYGVMCGSGQFDGLKSADGIVAVTKELEKLGAGKQKTSYRLRDWLVSRQRYWGTPIPMVHCSDCGVVPVPESDLPVELPYAVNFKPTGTSPLLEHSAFINTTCPKCGGAAKRDPDTLDTFVCSSWYYLRYLDNKNGKAAFSRKKIDALMPVDKYVGGAEHACMHLLYARFITKALKDMGYVGFDEPFKSLVHQGLILGADGNKMSKSKGNVANPDKYVGAVGADIFRLYLMFGFDFVEGGAWSDDGVKSAERFAERLERLVERGAAIKGTAKGGANGTAKAAATKAASEAASKATANKAPAKVAAAEATATKTASKASAASAAITTASKATVATAAKITTSGAAISASYAAPTPALSENDGQLQFALNQAIQTVTKDVEAFSFNTCIAALMKLTNAVYKYETGAINAAVYINAVSKLVLLFAPFAPAIGEELWSGVLGNKYSVFNMPFPKCDERALITKTVELAVQLNGKLRSKITADSGISDEALRALVAADAKIKELLCGAQIKKIIVVPNRLVNLIV